jgi:hypothetical protein
MANAIETLLKPTRDGYDVMVNEPDGSGGAHPKHIGVIHVDGDVVTAELDGDTQPPQRWSSVDDAEEFVAASYAAIWGVPQIVDADQDPDRPLI